MIFGTPPIVTTGLIMHLDAGSRQSYPGSGTTWTDLSGNGYSGSLTNGPTFNPANQGAITFVSSSNQYITRNTSLNTGQNFSGFAWIKPGAINIRNSIIGNSYPYLTGQGWFLSTATNYAGVTNTFFASVGSDNAYRTAANNSITPNTWNYVGCVFTNGGQNIQLYVNGTETSYVGGILASNTVTYTTQELYIGARTSTLLESFTGSIAQVQIYNRALSAQEVAQNYNALKNRFGLT